MIPISSIIGLLQGTFVCDTITVNLKDYVSTIIILSIIFPHAVYRRSKMKRNLYITLPKTVWILMGSLLIFVVLLSLPTAGFAQDETPPPPEEVTTEPTTVNVPVAFTGEIITTKDIDSFGNEFAFSLFNYSEQSLLSPYDEESYDFGFPDEWALAGSAYLHLDLGVFFERPDVVSGDTGDLFLENIPGGLLRIAFNGETLTTLVMDSQGEHTFTIPIPAPAFDLVAEDGRHEVFIELIADEYCLYGFETTVIVRPTSRILFPHQANEIAADLSLLPRPFFQNDSFWLNDAFLVVPDNPTSEELNAAMAVAAGFGRMTGGDLQLTLRPIGQLTAEERDINHLILVGEAAKFPGVGNLPAAVNEMTNSYPNDGVIYLGASPWNSTKSILLVSGASGQGVVKAGQAISTGALIGSVEPNLALVEAISSEASATSVPAKRLLTDLGYDNITMRGISTINRDILFYVPPGQTASDNAYFFLNFTHSTLLDYQRSGLLVTLNGEPIGSARFSDETAQGGEMQARIPKQMLRAGSNTLTLSALLLPRHICDAAIFGNHWFTALSDSFLQLPLLPMADNLTGRLLDLSLYPDAFALSPSEGSVAFVFPSNDPVAWNAASKVAFNIGDQTNWSLAEMESAFADNISDEIRQTHDLMIFGRASSLPIISELGDALPAPFDVGSDLPREQNVQVSYRVPAGRSVGMIELIRSPWNSERAILAVLGNSDDGVLWSSAALAVPELRGNLTGDFAIVQNQQIITSDSRLVGGGSDGTLDETVLLPELGDVSGAVAAPRPVWVLPVMAGTVILLVLIILIAAFSSWRRRRAGG